jgi:uncharacterized protein YgfB (UPF0149 family)
MGDIIIAEAVLDEFWQSLRAIVTKEQEGLAAEMLADIAMFRAQLEVARERKLREVEEKAEIKLPEVEEQIARRARAVEDKLCAFEDEIARLRQLERLRHTAAIERSEWPL